MHTGGLEHLVVHTRDVEQAVTFYRDLLGLAIVRLDAFRQGKVGFVSARASPEILIDIRPSSSGETVTPTMGHLCLVLGPTDMYQLHTALKAKGVKVEDDVRPAWGRKGMASSAHCGA
jgi:catechol 2,3-dioxygenase-like lactoylglutathione lyase family enzyme